MRRGGAAAISRYTSPCNRRGASRPGQHQADQGELAPDKWQVGLDRGSPYSVCRSGLSGVESSRELAGVVSARAFPHQLGGRLHALDASRRFRLLAIGAVHLHRAHEATLVRHRDAGSLIRQPKVTPLAHLAPHIDPVDEHNSARLAVRALQLTRCARDRGSALPSGPAIGVQSARAARGWV